MTLNGKVAAVFAAGGAIAGQVAHTLAQHGATVYVSGRNLKSVKALADRIKSGGANGMKAEAAQVDALNEAEIDAHLKTIARKEGKVDIVFNGIGLKPKSADYGTPTTALSFEKFVEPLRVIVGSQFLTSRAAARVMMETKTAGVILTLTASLSKLNIPFMAGIASACAGIEGLTRVMATEFAMAGIRVVCINPTALPETQTIVDTNELNAKLIGIPPEALLQMQTQSRLMKRHPSLSEVGEVAAFLASDKASAITGKIIDVDCG